MRVTRHDSTEAHLEYAEPDESGHSKQYRAMALKTVPDLKGEAKKTDVKKEETKSEWGMGTMTILGMGIMGNA